jgi:hypothetical protein
MLAPAALVAAALASGCASSAAVPPPAVPPTPAEMAQLWVEPQDLASRDLFAGPWGLDLAPDPAATYAFVSKKQTGFLKNFSPGYTVKDPKGVEWSAKLGPEAQAEVTASRLVWAHGFHQPPAY